MPISQKFVITIEFTGAASFRGGANSSAEIINREIRLVEFRTQENWGFTLFDGEKQEYFLSNDEVEGLRRLLERIEVKAPWRGIAGFDGTTYELTLISAMSSVTFSWWVEAPAEWEGARRVFDYVMEIADNS